MKVRLVKQDASAALQLATRRCADVLAQESPARELPIVLRMYNGLCILIGVPLYLKSQISIKFK